MKMVPYKNDTDAHYYLKGLGYVVSKFSKNKTAAKHYAAFASSYLGNWMEGVVELNGPTNLPALESVFFQERSPAAGVIKDSFAKGYRANVPGRAIIEDIVKDGTQDAIRGIKTPQEAIEWMESKILNR